MTVDPDGLLVDVVTLLPPSAAFLATQPVAAPCRPLGRFRPYFSDFERCVAVAAAVNPGSPQRSA